MSDNKIHIQFYSSPCGEMILGSYHNKLCLCDWQNEKRRLQIDARIRKGLQAEYVESSSDVLTQAITQLEEYFDNKRTAFDIPLLFVGTDFQQAVWRELLNIPYGQTASYAELSQRMNRPKAIRAIAAANGANAISVFVPCHRIIGSNQQLIGYAGGLPAKQLLLDLESPMNRLFRP
ncbi:MAG: methylated-DNA--[protein]-cysteine S-methyltransferase [Bacteroides sp.]|nr:methylated-DNA--[protein]-cysteine S-methyltransferase [Bacteroides sp.]